MRQIENWISDAAMRLGFKIEKLKPTEAQLVTQGVQRQFVEGPARVWWLGFKTPYIYYQAGSMRLSQVLPKTQGIVYLIPEEDDGLPLSVYATEADNLEALIGDCTFFEYYVADTGNDWVVAETEHDVLIVCYRADAPLRFPSGGQLWSSERHTDQTAPAADESERYSP